MTTYHATIEVRSEARPTYHDITNDVTELVDRSSVPSGIVLVSSPHTTCSVVIQEESHDRDYYGTEFLMQDLTDVLSQVVPTATSEGRYRHPGPAHIASARAERNEQAWWSLNVDAHLRSVLLGRSVSIPLVGSRLQLGQFGRIYFADFDQVRARERTVDVQVVG
jgi:thiamine phosphate synthase YjbQ (UPF0047 family)